MISFYCNFGDKDGRFAGTIYLSYRIEEIYELIDPLYEGVDNFNMWMYGKYGRTLDYQKPILQSGPETEMSQSVFDELIEKIYDP